MPPSPSPRRAAQYVRMSTEHQRYSIEYQSEANEAYASQHGISIVRTFRDAGISGLTLARRDGLKALIADTVGGSADYELIIVYDVSRWGRFQDPDEGAHYEYICRAAGIPIEYSAEPFDNDGSIVSSLLKHLKRAMAAEYSRELSVKVSKAQRGLAAKGYWQGGPPGLGLRRMSLNTDGSPRHLLQTGEQNAIVGNRIVLVLGPKSEVDLVRRIYHMFLEGTSTNGIARHLNDDGVSGIRGGLWSGAVVKNILRNEKYAGVSVGGRSRTHLGVSQRQPRALWIRAPGTLEPIVSEATYRAAQKQFRRRMSPVGDAEMLANLAALLAARGALSFNLINADQSTHSASSYSRRFGSLSAAYALVGYDPTAQQSLAMQRIAVVRPDRYRRSSMAKTQD